MPYLHFKARGGVPGSKKQGLFISKSKISQDLLLFTESQNLLLWQKHDAGKFGGIVQSHTNSRGIKWPKMAIFDHYFQNFLSPSVQTCPKDRFYQVLHFSLAFMYGNVEILKIRAKMVEKAHFFKNMFFSKSLKIILLLQKLS